MTSAFPTYRLEVAGGVEEPQRYGYQDLSALPQAGRALTFRCGTGETWGGHWRGVPLSVLLERSHPAPETTHILVEGAAGYVACVPVAKALDGLLALSRREGGPLSRSLPTRLVVPGIPAARSVKDIRRIRAVALPPGTDPEEWERGVDVDPAEWERLVDAAREP